MAFRIQRGRKDLAHTAVRLVVVTLAPLVFDDVALRVELRGVERVEEITHSIRLEPQRRFEIVRGNGLVIIGSIVRGRTVVAAADTFGELVMQAIWDVT